MQMNGDGGVDGNDTGQGIEDSIGELFYIRVEMRHLED